MNSSWKLRHFGLSLVLLTLFLFTTAGQLVTGYYAANEERHEKGRPPFSSVAEYASSGHFISALSENLESEFLQMALFVLLTVVLVQKGAAESRKPKDEMTKEDLELEEREEAYCAKRRAESPVLWRVYENSLSIALFCLFVFFFLLHGYGAWIEANENLVAMGKTPLRFLEIYVQSEFWFESFQNWESEFFSLAVLSLLSVFLRQRGSPQSKRLHDPHWKTGAH